jgi:hypothetical protein
MVSSRREEATVSYPTFQERNDVRYKYNTTLNQSDGTVLVFYTQIDDYATNIVFEDKDGELLPYDIGNDIEEAFERIQK